MKRHCFALDLINNPQLISRYRAYHKNVWPEIVKSIKDSGIITLEIYLVSNRLFMIMDVDESFTFERKVGLDNSSLAVQEWELLMWKYQKALPIAKEGEKWMLMDKIYEFNL